jgi:hypothetical protein
VSCLQATLTASGSAMPSNQACWAAIKAVQRAPSGLGGIQDVHDRTALPSPCLNPAIFSPTKRAIARMTPAS